MISALSHLQPSSGNKIWCVALCAVLAVGCSTTETLPRRTSNKKKPKRPKVTQVERVPQVDTISWTEVDVEDEPPIREYEQPGVERQDRYDIDVLFPFETAAISAVGDTEDRFVNYYAGMRIATDILNNQGKELSIDIHDVGSRTDDIEGRLSQWVDRETDLIVAPFHRKHVEAVADYGKKNRIPVVSPWLVSSRVTEKNPYYIKLMPDIADYYQAIMEDVSRSYGADQVIIIGDDTDDTKMTYLQDMGRTYYDLGDEDDDIRLFTVDLDSLANGETAFDEIFEVDRPTVFVIPNYSGSDESFIYNCVRRLSVEKADREVIVYGMPIMLDSDRMEFDYFNALSIHVARSKFVDDRNDRVQAFKRDYLSKYGAVPTVDAYQGYDMMMFVGESLWENGKNFQEHTSGRSDYYLQSAFDLQREIGDEAVMMEDYRDVEYFVNRQIDIIHFADARFQRK